MDALVVLAWRVYPASVLIVVGLTVMAWSVSRGIAAARREQRDPPRALAMLRGFRVGVGGLALAGIGAAWCWQLGWLLGLSLIIGGEELLESTVVIAALRHGAERASQRVELDRRGETQYRSRDVDSSAHHASAAARPGRPLPQRGAAPPPPHRVSAHAA